MGKPFTSDKDANIQREAALNTIQPSAKTLPHPDRHILFLIMQMAAPAHQAHRPRPMAPIWHFLRPSLQGRDTPSSDGLPVLPEPSLISPAAPTVRMRRSLYMRNGKSPATAISRLTVYTYKAWCTFGSTGHTRAGLSKSNQTGLIWEPIIEYMKIGKLKKSQNWIHENRGTEKIPKSSKLRGKTVCKTFFSL